MLLVEMKHFHALIENNLFFDHPVKNKQEEHEKHVDMPRNSVYTTGNLLDYLYHQKYDKLIGLDLSRQTNTSISQKTNFCKKIRKKMMVQQCFLSLKRSEKLF